MSPLLTLAQSCVPRVGGWIRPAQQFRMGQEGKEWRRGGGEPWLLSWHELCPRDSLKQWALTAHVEMHPRTFWNDLCVREKTESCDWAAEARLSKPQTESVEQSRSRKNQGYVSPHRKRSDMLCGCVKKGVEVDVSGVGEDEPVPACRGFIPSHPLNGGPHLEARKEFFLDLCSWLSKGHYTCENVSVNDGAEPDYRFKSVITHLVCRLTCWMLFLFFLALCCVCSCW